MKRGYHSIKHARGVTLMELVIVVAMIAIFMSLAGPNYTAYVTRSNRADAMQSLVLLANAQEQYLLSNKSYATDIANLPTFSTSREGHYQLSVVSANASSFILQANPNGALASGRQKNDGRFRLSSTDNRVWDCGNNNSFSCDWQDK